MLYNAKKSSIALSCLMEYNEIYVKGFTGDIGNGFENLCGLIFLSYAPCINDIHVFGYSEVILFQVYN